MSRADTVVTFSVAGSTFAVEVGLVQEILSAQRPTRLPNSPPHLLGLIDVRGSSVALVDLRQLLGEAPGTDDEDTRIMLLNFSGGARTHRVALRVDRVIEVCGLDNEGQILPVEEADMIAWDPRVLRGIGRREGAIVALLDILAIFDREGIPPSSPAGSPVGRAAADLTCAQ